MISWEFWDWYPTFFKKKYKKDVVRNFACCDVNIKDNDVTV